MEIDDNLSPVKMTPKMSKSDFEASLTEHTGGGSGGGRKERGGDGKCGGMCCDYDGCDGDESKAAHAGESKVAHASERRT